MYPISRAVTFGISPHLLYAQSSKGPLRHLEAVAKAAALDGYETLELFLPDDPEIRRTEIAIVRDAGKRINYNFPIDFQCDGEINAGSPNPRIRENALCLARRNIDYAEQAGSSLLAITSCIDQGAEARPAVLERFAEFCEKIAAYAKPAGITIAIEAAERGIFKNLALGPTIETAAFVKSVKERGCTNISIMIDTAHLPLMEEDASTALALSLEAGLGHIHIGNSVLDSASPYYGHQHPPLGIQGGVYDTPDAEQLFYELLLSGYLSDGKPAVRPMVSLEMMPYPGVSPETSARVAYEKISRAFDQAVRSYRTLYLSEQAG